MPLYVYVIPVGYIMFFTNRFFYSTFSLLKRDEISLNPSALKFFIIKIWDNGFLKKSICVRVCFLLLFKNDFLSSKLIQLNKWFIFCCNRFTFTPLNNFYSFYPRSKAFSTNSRVKMSIFLFTCCTLFSI